MAAMNSIGEFFAHLCATVRTLLRSASVLYLSAEFPPLKSDLLGDLSKLTQASIERMLTQKALCHNPEINILKKDTVSTITKLIGKLKVQVTALVGNVPVLPRYGYSGFLIMG